MGRATCGEVCHRCEEALGMLASTSQNPITEMRCQITLDPVTEPADSAPSKISIC